MSQISDTLALARAIRLKGFPSTDDGKPQKEGEGANSESPASAHAESHFDLAVRRGLPGFQAGGSR